LKKVTLNCFLIIYHFSLLCYSYMKNLLREFSVTTSEEVFRLNYFWIFWKWMNHWYERCSKYFYRHPNSPVLCMSFTCGCAFALSYYIDKIFHNRVHANRKTIIFLWLYRMFCITHTSGKCIVNDFMKQKVII
jgi:hypothetical protein